MIPDDDDDDGVCVCVSKALSWGFKKYRRVFDTTRKKYETLNVKVCSYRRLRSIHTTIHRKKERRHHVCSETNGRQSINSNVGTGSNPGDVVLRHPSVAACTISLCVRVRIVIWPCC